MTEKLDEEINQLDSDRAKLTAKLRAEEFEPTKKFLREEKSRLDLKILELEKKVDQIRTEELRKKIKAKLAKEQRNLRITNAHTNAPIPIKENLTVDVVTTFGYVKKLNLIDIMPLQSWEVTLRTCDTALLIPINDTKERNEEIERLEKKIFKSEKDRQRLYNLRQGTIQTSIIVKKV